MAISTRAGLSDYCLRRLGDPVIEINIDEQQLSDRIDDGIQFFQENIFDGIEKVFMQHTVTATDVTNKWIPADDPILGVIRVFPAKGLFSGSFFDQEFQLRVTDLNTFTGISSIDFYINATNFNLLEQLLATERSFTFNRVQNRIGINAKWGSDINEGDILVIEAYRILDPETFTEIYDHPFLKQYTTALIKKQWGANLSKFDGVVLPGGITLNGLDIFNDANDEIARLEDTFMDKWTEPPLDQVG